ncbi:hypothetical protein BAY61_20320 [Prauserella marina]|uniref:Uncharacterized protein n=1 Tax=Prauserella marina TaxID=530584 RepID=A0A222VSQ6_9PSEU|nr:hypothetical protein [Prauserella marina]ASR36939.1 hypothetical protein BAY61_20320 [Prauserella marina]PWV80108.1 hypothetical protein DES30_103198 [Prauserella marina]SDD83047.1 hypothetical protein SAMN05421630_11319 [Prauserella marina]
MKGEQRPWPRTVRLALLLALLTVAGVGMVVLLRAEGFLTVSGVFVAMIVGPVVVLLGRLWLHRRWTRCRRDLVERLPGFRLDLERERVLAVVARSTGASDEALDTAIAALSEAKRHFAACQDSAGAAGVTTCAQRISDEWASGAAITRQARGLAKQARLLARLQTRAKV